MATKLDDLIALKTSYTDMTFGPLILDKIADAVVEVDGKIDALDTKIDELDTKIDGLEARVEALEP